MDRNMGSKGDVVQGGGEAWVNFCGYVLLASQSPYPIIYSVANYIPHLSHFWANM